MTCHEKLLPLHHASSRAGSFYAISPNFIHIEGNLEGRDSEFLGNLAFEIRLFRLEIVANYPGGDQDENARYIINAALTVFTDGERQLLEGRFANKSILGHSEMT